MHRATECVRVSWMVCQVLVSSSLRFAYYNLDKGAEIMQTQGASALPAVMTQMTIFEATQRMMKTSSFKNLFYNGEGSGREYYYPRFDVDREMENDLDLTRGMLRCLHSCKHMISVTARLFGNV